MRRVVAVGWAGLVGVQGVAGVGLVTVGVVGLWGVWWGALVLGGFLLVGAWGS